VIQKKGGTMKIEAMNIEDYGPPRVGRSESEEKKTIELMLPNTALIIKESTLACKRGTGSCSIAAMLPKLRLKHPDRTWSVKHLPEGHAIGCFPSNGATPYEPANKGGKQ
jgi:hypothetical protein